MKYCMKCGSQLHETARFCNNCGEKQPEPNATYQYQEVFTAETAAIPAEKKRFDWQIPKECTHDEMTVQKYNALLAGLLLYGFGLCAVICDLFAVELMFANPITLVIMYLGSAFLGGYLAHHSSNTAVRFVGFNLIVVPSGAVVASLLPYYHYETVLYAMLGTAILAGVMLVAALVRPQSFEGIGSVLLVCLVSVVVVEMILLIFFGRSSTFIDLAVIVVMAGFVGYDFVQANKAARTVNNAIAFGIDLYLDMINIFVRLLSIFGSRD